jgi:hypothetical protein
VFLTDYKIPLKEEIIVKFLKIYRFNVINIGARYNNYPRVKGGGLILGVGRL